MENKKHNWTIYHNGDCSKSRLAVDFLREQQIDFTIRDYISNPLSKEEILDLQRFLGIPIIGLVRLGDMEFVQQQINKQLIDSEVVDLLVEYPKLLQRPIVRKGNLAIIARPVEKINSLL